MKSAYFAGGCFWCITPVFDQAEGVFAVISGYSGGQEDHPAYEQVKAQQTGHRETIRIDYDETRISYATLLDLFLKNTDPFDEGGQFIDRGHSYTLAVYYKDDSEASVVKEKIQHLADKTGRTVHVSVERFICFWPAEEYHQQYYLKNPEAFEKELRDSGRKNIHQEVKADQKA